MLPLHPEHPEARWALPQEGPGDPYLWGPDSQTLLGHLSPQAALPLPCLRPLEAAGVSEQDGCPNTPGFHRCSGLSHCDSRPTHDSSHTLPRSHGAREPQHDHTVTTAASGPCSHSQRPGPVPGWSREALEDGREETGRAGTTV